MKNDYLQTEVVGFIWTNELLFEPVMGLLKIRCLIGLHGESWRPGSEMCLFFMEII